MNNILFCQFSSIPGGSIKSLYEIVNYLPKNQYNFKLLVSMKGSAEQLFEDKVQEIYNIKLGQISNNSHRQYNILKQILIFLYVIIRLPLDTYILIYKLKIMKYDLIYINNTNLISIGIISKILRKKIIWHIREIICENFLGKFQKFIINYCSNYIITITKSEEKKYNKSKVITIYNGITPVQINCNRNKNTNIKKIIAWGNLSKKLIYNKGFYFLLDSIKIALNSGIIFDTWILGDDLIKNNKSSKNGLNNLKFYANKLGISDRIKFWGYQKDVLSFIIQADIAVIPHLKSEPFGRAILEAGITKTPIISTDIEPTNEILRNGIDAILVLPNDKIMLANSILTLLNDNSLGFKLANNFFKRIDIEFNGQEQNKKIYNIIKELTK